MNDIKKIIEFTCSLTRLKNNLENEIGKVFKQQKLTSNQSIFLLAVYFSDSPTLSMLQQLLGMKQSAMSDKVKNLKAEGLLELKKTGRYSCINLSEKAYKIISSELKSMEYITEKICSSENVDDIKNNIDCINQRIMVIEKNKKISEKVAKLSNMIQ